mmetsp:Transcript_41968/g.104380  ORF Transcript_41968/g.104380 Transcript_41968/m.104380 type:complete len:238 (-) Transcript_41968:1-714(-)
MIPATFSSATAPSSASKSSSITFHMIVCPASPYGVSTSSPTLIGRSLSARYGLSESSKMSQLAAATLDAKGSISTRLASSIVTTEAMTEAPASSPVLRRAEADMRTSPSASESSAITMHTTFRCLRPRSCTWSPGSSPMRLSAWGLISQSEGSEVRACAMEKRNRPTVSTSPPRSACTRTRALRGAAAAASTARRGRPMEERGDSAAAWARQRHRMGLHRRGIRRVEMRRGRGEGRG